MAVLPEKVSVRRELVSMALVPAVPLIGTAIVAKLRERSEPPKAFDIRRRI
jgi:hypothetical protein